MKCGRRRGDDWSFLYLSVSKMLLCKCFQEASSLSICCAVRSGHGGSDSRANDDADGAEHRRRSPRKKMMAHVPRVVFRPAIHHRGEVLQLFSDVVSAESDRLCLGRTYVMLTLPLPPPAKFGQRRGFQVQGPSSAFLTLPSSTIGASRRP